MDTTSPNQRPAPPDRRTRPIGAGTIALPLIVLAAVCWVDQIYNAVDYVRPSMAVAWALSFPLGSFAGWLANALAHAIVPNGGVYVDVAVSLARFAGGALNIYMVSAFVIYLARRQPPSQEARVTEEELRRRLDEHHKQRS